jgi:hypothetical protein
MVLPSIPALETIVSCLTILQPQNSSEYKSLDINKNTHKRFIIYYFGPLCETIK